MAVKTQVARYEYGTSLVRTGLTFSASTIALAPSLRMRLPLRYSLVRTGLTARQQGSAARSARQ